MTEPVDDAPETSAAPETPDESDAPDSPDVPDAPEAPRPRRGPPGTLDARADELPVRELDDPARLRSVIESLLLVAEQPLAPRQLHHLLGSPALEKAEIREILADLERDLDERGSGIRLVRVAGGVRLRSDPANAPWVRAMTRQRPIRLSRPALETAAIVAYRQPVTRADVDDVRGVDSSVVLRSLLQKDLIRIVGRKDEPGRPMLYGTTRKFLEVFGLASVRDLPSLKEFTDLAVAEQEDLFGAPGAPQDQGGGRLGRHATEPEKADDEDAPQ